MKEKNRINTGRSNAKQMVRLTFEKDLSLKRNEEKNTTKLFKNIKKKINHKMWKTFNMRRFMFKCFYLTTVCYEMCLCYLCTICLDSILSSNCYTISQQQQRDGDVKNFFYAKIGNQVIRSQWKRSENEKRKKLIVSIINYI